MNRMDRSGGTLGAAIAAAADRLGAALQRLCEAEPGRVDAVIAQQFSTAVALLAHFCLASPSALAADYLSGWLRLVARQHAGKMKPLPFARSDLDAVWAEWRSALLPVLSGEDAERFEEIVAAADSALSVREGKTVRVLVIGDCLLWDVALQLQILAASQGVVVEPVIRAERVGADLRRALANYAPDQFDLVFYSPYSFAFSAEYESVTSPRNLLRWPAGARASLQDSLQDVQKTIALLARHFSCPVHVHCVSGLRQFSNGWRGWLVAVATAPQRAWASSVLNAALDAFIDALNAGLERPVLRLDEAEPLRQSGAFELGKVAFDAGELHPTRLAEELARTGYMRAVLVAARLSARKLIVCDLDNTLWQGVIGDGAVRHHTDRQQTLKRLKAAGVVLAISSKNDPANVRWDGAVLSAQDFVTAEINWNPKAPNIRRMAEVLNLGHDSFIFLDDRPDEREMVSNALPGLMALDPNRDDTWALLGLWADMARASAVADRTVLYQERAERQRYLDATASGADDIAEAFGKLGLRLSLRHPGPSEMGRVVELINRTNQFNTTGARTTMAEMTASQPERRIAIAEAGDKFGEMGIVGVMVVEVGPTPVISHFVLSCRVFGFGIEDAMLNSLRRAVLLAPLSAPLVETAVNGPCRDVYARHGFRCQDGLWWSEGGGIKADPCWLAIVDRTEWAGLAVSAVSS